MSTATDTAERTDARRRMIRVWDPVVRIGHWVLVAGFAVAFLTEGEPEWLHTWAGYAVAATVVLRVVWGFVGPEKARFATFVVGPVRALAYVGALVAGKAPRHVGHSPAGGLMAVMLLAALAGTTWTGMALYAQEENAGPLAPWYGGGQVAVEAPALVAPAFADEDEHEYGDHGEYGDGDQGDEGDGAMEDLHETFANVTLVLVLLHLGGVAAGSLAHRENLPRAMVDGLKRP